MDKYICTVCEYIYDPELGDPETALRPVPHSKTSPTTGYARCVASVKKILR